MKDVVNRIFPRRMSVCVEVGKWEIAARIDGEANFSDQIMSLGSRFRTTYRAFEIRIANAKLIVILRVWLEFLRLDLLSPGGLEILQKSKIRVAYLQSVIYIGACIGYTRVYHVLQRFVLGNYELETDGSSRRGRMLLVSIINRHWIIHRDVARDCRIIVDVVILRCASGPQYY